MSRALRLLPAVLSLALSWPAFGFAPADEPGVPTGPKPAAWVKELAGYATYEQVKGLPDGDREDLVAIIKDATWPKRHVDYLQDAKHISPDAFVAQPKDKQGETFLEWLRQRAKARDLLAMASGAPALSDQDMAILQSYARAGFYGPELTKRLLGPDSPAVAKLTSFGESLKTGDAAARLGQVFDNSAKSPDLQKIESRMSDALDLHSFQNPGKKPDEMAQNYQVSRQMVMDPAAFRASRPDLFKGSTKEDLKLQDNLPTQIGHVYQTMDYLRQQGRLELAWADPKDMGGNAVADTSIHVERSKTGEAQWKIVVRVNDNYKGVDPVLVAPFYTHEFLHAYDFYQHIQHDGIETAQIVADFQEEEMRAFITQGHVDTAYAGPIKTAALRQPHDRDAQILYQSSLASAELARDRDADPQAYKASLAKLAQNTLRERGYSGLGGGINSLASMQAQYQDVRRNLQAELIQRTRGDDGLDEAIAAATKAKDYDLRAALVIQKTRPARDKALIETDLQRTDTILRALGDEQKRGLALKADSGLKTKSVPLP